MLKISPIPARKLMRVFERAGFTCVRIEGDHYVYTKEGVARAFVEGEKGKIYPKLLIDTGSAYTILSQEMLEFIGCSPVARSQTGKIIAKESKTILIVL